jgi:hypothetical protein
MAYIVNKTDGTVVATVADGTIDTTSTSVTLLGKGFNNYGEIVAEDWVHMVEHFAFGNAPTSALRGQLWYDTTQGVMRVNVSDTFGAPTWNTLGNAVVQATAPTQDGAPDFRGFGIGTLWYDTVNASLKISVDGLTFSPVTATIVGTSEPDPNDSSSGDLFYDTTTKQLKVLNGDIHGVPGTKGWDVVGPARYTGPTAPTTVLADGDEWWNSTTKQLFIYDGTAATFRLVGPSSPSGTSGFGNGLYTGTAGAEVDGNALLLQVVDGNVLGIWSPVDFTPTKLLIFTNAGAGGTVALSTVPPGETWRFHHADDSPIPALERGLNLSTINDASSGITGDGNTGNPTVLNGVATQAQYS